MPGRAPRLAKVARELAGQVRFVGVNSLDDGQGLGMARQFGIDSWPLAVDLGAGGRGALRDNLGGEGMPITAFYDSAGTLLCVAPGAPPEQAVRAGLHRIYRITGCRTPRRCRLCNQPEIPGVLMVERTAMGEELAGSLRTLRLLAWLLTLALIGGACAQSGGGAQASRDSSGPSVSLGQATPSPRENTPSALEDPAAPGLPRPIVDPAEIISGGPPPDGIPAIDHPRFQRATEVTWLKDREPVLAFQIGADIRAYPVQILVWHEIVNDTVGGIPVAVTYCPLCNSAVALDRRLDNKILDFGTSGLLYRSALVMYDRQTRSLWSHFVGQSIAGVLTGRTLTAYPVSTVSWADWRRSYPSGWVLSRDTGFPRDYGNNPYVGYDDPRTDPFLFRGTPDPRLPAKTRVVGIQVGNETVAVVTDELRKARALDLQLGGKPLVVWLKPGTASPLDASRVAQGREVGATEVFGAVVDGRDLHFQAASEGFRDQETGSLWDLFGHASSGPLAGRSLVPITHVDTFWFAWAAFRPETQVFPPLPSRPAP